MNPLEFKKKWALYRGKESAGYVEHFNDLCSMLGLPTPAAADPTGDELFCFQKRVIKDAELFALREETAEYGDAAKRGFADVWKKDCFAWEYKGKKKNLDEAYQQLLRYREALLNPPLLVVCDFDRYVIRTNFNGTVQDVIEFTNDQVDQPRSQRILRALFTDPDQLKPQKTTDRVTEELAERIAKVAQSLNKRECIEYSNARRRAEVNVAMKKNLRVARFLNRVIFCFFAEDVGLLPDGTFTEVTKAGLTDPHFFAERLEELFRVMARGGTFGVKKIRHFNGHLFDEATVFELTPDEISELAQASESDWQFIEPSILGTLFERALDVDQRAQLGAHYTSKADIETLVEPVLMAPLRREWKDLRKTKPGRKPLDAFLKKLRSVVVLDPACGSGNFLYVSLQRLLDLEKQVLAYAESRDMKGLKPGVSVQQLRAIEINPYAFELAQVAVQIGYLQWLRDNGFGMDRDPVLQNLDGFENADALMREVFKRKPKDLKEARQSEHETYEGVKGYVEKAWPECDVIVSNPPFLGDKLMRGELGDRYLSQLHETFESRIPKQSDLCCYWFEKARALIKEKQCHRAGLLATQGIRGGANREVLKRIRETGDIFWAESDRPWILAGANVHVSMVGFDNGAEKERTLDGKRVPRINANLSSLDADITTAGALDANQSVAYQGVTPAGPFIIDGSTAMALLKSPTPHGKPASDVIRPYLNASDLMQRGEMQWIVDFGIDMPMDQAALYEQPFAYASEHVKPFRAKAKSSVRDQRWWLHLWTRHELRRGIAALTSGQFVATPRVSKHRVIVLVDSVYVPSDATVGFIRDDDYFFGVLHSRFHEVWALAQGTQLREKESGFRYTPTTCFETFPFPEAGRNDDAIAAAAKELNDLRERWLNPPEWTKTEILEFPGTVGGPWDRYIQKTDDGGRMTEGEVGMVRYPRLIPKDEACAAKLKDRTLTKLYNERPAWLDLAHKKLDAAVAEAYGWPADLSDDEILSRLLALNLERAAAEAKSATPARKPQRAKAEDELI